MFEQGFRVRSVAVRMHRSSNIEVFRKNADGSLTSMGTSGNNPGTPEQVILTGDKASPGTYVLRVSNFAAAVGTWTAKVGRYRKTTTVTTGSPEPYTMTCEVRGQVVRSAQVFVARGQALSLDPCGSVKHKPKPHKQAGCTAKARRKHGKARTRALRRCTAMAKARKRTQG